MSHTSPVGEPYALAGKRLAFTNWHYVRPGLYGWYDNAGNNVTVGGDQRWGEADLRLTDSPRGVRLITHPATRSGPVLREEQPWEAGGYPVLTTILQDQGRYRGWGMVGGWGDLKGRGQSYFCYYESDDGLHWRRPDCGVFELDGSRENNILATEGGTVFVDPSAPAHERYKYISDATYTPQQAEAYRQRRECGEDRKANRTDAGFYIGVRGACSPDGLRWTVIENPLALMHADTQLVAYYDTQLKRYVGYVRDWAVGPRADGHDGSPASWIGIGRRSIGRAETADFREWPLSDLILEPPLWLTPSQVLYTNCRTSVPGAPDQHLMFPAAWDMSTDRTHLIVAASSDGRSWNWLPQDAPLLDTAAPGEWDGGCIFASPNLIELPDGSFALPYAGYDVPHKFPRKRATRATGYALWPKGRWIGIDASEEGSFATPAFIPPGRKLLINAAVRDGGSLRVEAAALGGTPLEGRAFDDCVVLGGDRYRAAVVWKHHDSLATDSPVMLRFRMRAATVYSIDFE